MSNRRAGNGNRIRGPHSALTDFLAANNISAAQIRDDYERRRQQGQQQNTSADNAAAEQAQDELDDAAAEAQAAEEAANRSKKRKRETLAKIKQSKVSKKKGKAGKKHRGSDEDSDDDYDDSLAHDMYKKAKPAPGQLENCEVCNKRFTVTPYSKTGPDGGLLCTKCGKELAADSKPEKKAKTGPTGRKRRKFESDRLDGVLTHGSKTLTQLCIEKIVQHHADVEELGDLPDSVLERLNQIFSKERVLKSNTLKLFLHPNSNTIAIHEAAYLEEEDYEQMFAIVPRVEKLVLKNACQFKDEAMEYMLEKAHKLKHVQLYAANLVSNKMWIKLFRQRGEQLKTLQLTWLDAAFDDDAVAEMALRCPNLNRLKLKLCRRVGEEAIEFISRLTKLEHLSLQTSQPVSSETLINLIRCIGANLRTLSLEKFVDADDIVLEAIRTHCRHLTKLRLSENDYHTDAGFTALFTSWSNPPLTFVDVNSTRDVDNNNPNGPEEPNGLAAKGLTALMSHSGSKLQYLNIASCRHITHQAFAEVFDGETVYPELKEIDLSFCSQVDTVIVAGIFRSCPALKRLIAFGCFGVEDVVVPKDIVLIGVPRAQDAIEQFGNAWMDVGSALEGMAGLVEVSA